MSGLTSQAWYHTFASPVYLNEADIFLNTALTEAFCIAIVEAARMGLLTDVFGRITFNGRFYQLILQVLIGFTRSHVI